MNRPAPYRQGFAARRPSPPPRTPHQVRADWVAVIDLARICAEGVSDDCLPPGKVAELMAGLRRTELSGFPVKSFSAQTYASAFLTLARAWVAPELGPEARLMGAPSLRALAVLLDNVMDGLRREEAAIGRRSTGERED